MLQHIHIKDLVIVHSLELELVSGMTALTGETGAGKSILIDALGLALGNKADKGMIRTGCEKAEVTALFQIEKRSLLHEWLLDQEWGVEDECVVRRVLLSNGRSRAFINGTPVPVQMLKTLGDFLLDIHGQHEHLSLLKPASQLSLLDAYAGHDALLEQVACSHREWKQGQKQLADLKHMALEREQRMDYLRYQLEELVQLGLAENELAMLEQDHHRLAHAEQLVNECLKLHQLLYETEGAVQQVLSKAVSKMEELIELDAALGETAAMLDSARIHVEEAASQLRQYTDSVDMDPQLLQQIDNRLANVMQMARKHKVAAEQLPAHQTALQRELAELASTEKKLGNLAEKVEHLEKTFKQSADRLSHSRAIAAEKLSGDITASMQELGLKGGSLEVVLTKQSLNQSGPQGLDQCMIQVSTNPGQQLAPLAKVASGGELSRISLAIQVATANCGAVPTLIFDEVDVGIGGGRLQK